MKSKVSEIIFPQTAIHGGTRKRLYSLVPTYERVGKFEFQQGQKVYFAMLADIIQREDTEALQQILQSPMEDVELIDIYTGTTILHLAAIRINSIMWDMLLVHPQFKKYMDKPDLRGTTPLIAACWYGNKIAVDSLIQGGADPRKSVGDSNKTVLHICAEQYSEEICEDILKDSRSAQVLDQTDSEGNTALMISVMFNSPTSKVLIKFGANCRILNPMTLRHILHLAVVFSNYEIQNYCVKRIHDLAFLDHPDINDDTPLSLAMAIFDEYSVEILLESQHGKQLVNRCQKSLHSLVEENKIHILKTVSYFEEDPDFYEIFDEKGRTPLLLAAELNRIGVVLMFHDIDVNFETRNKYTDETVLHIAAKSQNEELIEVIFNSVTNHEKISAMEDHFGLTAYEIILANASYRVWKTWTRCSLVEYKFKNSSEESALLIAAKGGNYILVLALLLSRRFNTYFDRRQKISKRELLNLEVKRAVYSSDIFVVFGLDTGKRGWKTSPTQDYLFQRSAKGLNIFHACALGGNMDCLRFIYNYCKKFKENIWQVDYADKNGNTPLFYAVLGGRTDLAKYFLTHGSNMASTNALGWSPLHAIAAHNKFDQLLDEVIAQSATMQTTDEEGEQLILSFQLLQPDSVRQMEVIWSMYENLRGTQHMPILTNPVLEYFVLYKWAKIENFVSFKLFSRVVLVFSYTMYLSLKLSVFVSVNEEFIYAFRYIALTVGTITIFFNIPVLFYRKSHFALYLLSSLSVLCYLESELQTRIGMELAAIALLLSWLSLFMGTHMTKMSYQLAVLQKILFAVIKLLPLCLVLLTGFSLFFFTLFHDYFIFNNPLRSFFTIAIHMREGELKTPVQPLLDPMVPINPKQGSVFQSEDLVSNPILNVNEQLRNLFVEGTFIFLFKFLVVICTFNLLVDAAIKGVIEFEGEGKLQKLKNYVHELAFWELVLNSKLYTFCNQLRITWILALPQDLRDELRIPSEINPLNNPIPEFDSNALKWMVFDRAVVEPQKKFFKYMWEKEQESYEKTIKKGLRFDRKRGAYERQIHSV